MTSSVDSNHEAVDSIVVEPVNYVRGELRIPGDKSISHRAAMIASLARGQSTLENFSTARDCEATLDCLRQLGVSISKDGSSVVVHGVGVDGLQESSTELNAQNSGTTMRLLAGILAGQPFKSTITGDASLRSRPMRRIAEPLRIMGASIELQEDGCAPIRIGGHRPLSPINYQIPIASAQLKSAVLLAGLGAEGTTMIVEVHPTRDHTERMLPEFGAKLSVSGNVVSLQGQTELHACDLRIPGDLSSAAFFIAAAVALPGSDLVIRDIGLNPTRTSFVSKLSFLGAQIELSDERIENGEPVGTVHVRGVPINNRPRFEVSGSDVPALIDELPLLGFLSASVGWEMVLREAQELRFKECDRISTTVANLRRMGAKVEERDDGWTVHFGDGLRGAQLSSYGDHRIAMSSAVAALSATGASQIEDTGNSVAVSLPEFWSLLESVAS
jgi:3-phosphoshikimate 1-carboxyvinyltransferase